ncbi:hypothetical protein [Streptomyces sp. 6N223]|uniref:hypothetical protein n=1 Tax=Streptomyces sp. 6N223 TaxID=3457412 RepID=UPI003FD3F55B
MKYVKHKLAALLMVLAAAVGTALVPAGQAQGQQDGQWACYRAQVLCLYEETDGHGFYDFLWPDEDRPVLHPPAKSALNLSEQTFCFYSDYFFQGKTREVSGNNNEKVHDFGWREGAKSVKSGRC